MRRILNTFFAGIALNFIATSLPAADLKLEARLIWGANDQKENVKFEPVDPHLAEKLHRMFRWENYYEITNKFVSIPLNQSRDVKMSDACVIRVRYLGASRLEVSCIGHGKQVHKGNYTLVPPQWLVLGGNGVDNTAWFVGLRATDKKIADAK